MPAIKMSLNTLKDVPPWEWPEDAGTMLLSVLRDDGAEQSDLLLAVELAGDLVVINDELVEALLSVLRSADKSEVIRGTSAIALGPVLEHVDTLELEDRSDAPITDATFHGIQKSLRTLYMDASVPENVRRGILEASVRATEDWHEKAVRIALASDDEGWRLTAVFCMRFVRGFEDEILTALHSANPDIHYEAVLAAGTWGVDAAWPHVVALVRSDETSKALLLAAIDAVVGLRPHETAEILVDLADSDDEDIAAAVEEAMVMAQALDEDDDPDDDDELLH
jgi:hypothetical protein